MSKDKYFFKNINELVGYIYWFSNENNFKLSPLKLQKSLYFLYAYYLAIYSEKDFDSDSGYIAYPDELFKAEFEAWDYGPVIKKIYKVRKHNQNFFKAIASNKNFIKKINTGSLFNHVEDGLEIKSFIDDVLFETLTTSDFFLASRSQQDKCWQWGRDRRDRKMINDQIKQEYINKYKEED